MVAILEHMFVTRRRWLGRKAPSPRSAPPSIPLALLWSQPTCSRPGCDQTWAHAEVDHRVPWVETHRTELHGLDRLCRHDHRLKTDHGWALVAGTGTRPMVPPDHPDHPDHADRVRARPP
jgi:hypothetical protein